MLWAVLQPLITMMIFAVIFGKLANIPSDGTPYPLFAFAALLPWTLFSQSLARSGASLVGNSNLITKIYFPRLLIPLSATVSPIVDFTASLLLMLPMMAWYGITPGPGIASLPFLVLLTLLASLATGLWLSALNVRYRDVGYVIPFMIQVWMYASPIAYPASIIPEKWRMLYGLNPMAGVIEGFRWALLDAHRPDLALMTTSTAVLVLLLAGGLIYFKRIEDTFADII